MDFILAPAVTGICVYGFYKFVELLVHRKERLLMIEKITDIATANEVNVNKIFNQQSGGSRYIALRFGSMFVGIGLGLLVGFMIGYMIFGASWFTGGDNLYRVREAIGIIYGSSTLLFGGAALLMCFMLEQKYHKESK